MKSIKMIQFLLLAALSFGCFVNSFAMDGRDNPQQPLLVPTFRLSATEPSSSTSLTLSALSSHDSSSVVPVSASITSEAPAIIPFAILEEEAEEVETDVCESSSSSSSNSPPKKSQGVKRNRRIHFSDWTVDNYQEAPIFKMSSDLFVHTLCTYSSLSDAACLARVCKVFNKNVLTRCTFEPIIIRELLEKEPSSLMHKFVKALATYNVRKDQESFNHVFIRLFLQKAIFENDPRFGKFRRYIFQKLMEHRLLILLGNYADMFIFDESFRGALHQSAPLALQTKMRVNCLAPQTMAYSNILNLALQTKDKKMFDDWIQYAHRIIDMHRKSKISSSQWNAYLGLFKTTLLCQDKKWRNTPLHWACCAKNVYAIKALLEICSSLNLVHDVVVMINARGDTPLHCAISQMDYEVVCMLLKKWITTFGANANINIFMIRNNNNRTIRELAFSLARHAKDNSIRHTYKEIVEAVSEAQQNPNVFLVYY